MKVNCKGLFIFMETDGMRIFYLVEQENNKGGNRYYDFRLLVVWLWLVKAYLLASCSAFTFSTIFAAISPGTSS